MPEEVRYCEADGFFEGEQCPTCGESGRAVVGGSRRRQLSKFLSGALRHFPEDAGVELDDAGWTALSSLVVAVERKYDWADRETVVGVVATDPKGRFERDGAGRVRAAYGHSVDVRLDADDGPVPDTLYHGTAPRNVAAIREEGLRPMNRQQVHLSEGVSDAREVGRRHAEDPVVFAVDAAAMLADGRDIARRGTATYTTDRVPPTYLTRLGSD
jgi:putative RNA 2'-phosphotransferase